MQVASIEQQLVLPAWQDTAALRRSVLSVQQHMQQVVPALLQQQEDLFHNIRDLIRSEDSHQDHFEDLMGSSSRGSGSSQQYNPARVGAAVAARLQQKLITETTAELCTEVICLLQSVKNV